MSGIENLLNKKVVIQLNSGYKKFGILTGYDVLFLYVQYDSGETVSIPLVSVAQVSHDTR